MILEERTIDPTRKNGGRVEERRAAHDQQLRLDWISVLALNPASKFMPPRLGLGWGVQANLASGQVWEESEEESRKSFPSESGLILQLLERLPSWRPLPFRSSVFTST